MNRRDDREGVRTQRVDFEKIAERSEAERRRAAARLLPLPLLALAAPLAAAGLGAAGIAGVGAAGAAAGAAGLAAGASAFLPAVSFEIVSLRDFTSAVRLYTAGSALFLSPAGFEPGLPPLPLASPPAAGLSVAFSATLSALSSAFFFASAASF